METPASSNHTVQVHAGLLKDYLTTTIIFCPHQESKIMLLRQVFAYTGRSMVPVSWYLLTNLNKLRRLWRLNLWSTKTSSSRQRWTVLNVLKKLLKHFFSLQFVIMYLVLFPSILTQSHERYQIIIQVNWLQTWRRVWPLL